ncbi:MAG: CDP-diacylglycerol--serine O-phosphatidyltransferase [Chlamydiae bacterium]|nr:CDP-diacylglycerol--serine O-phosphatidyltransferase [Chlamydiota bacterium]MBI3276422.1 CDP-diacylglycerol--serine O-phosphatidyltransferase [Chlamydiota bacterium]
MRKIYLLPNLMTTGNFLCGMISVSLSLKGDFPSASLWILVAMLFDFLDGQVARLSKSMSKFGEEYDSLCDLMTFGIAPTILIYEMSLSKLGRMGISIAFIYSVCCALRLARYNAKLNKPSKYVFSGLPSTAAGGAVAASVIAADHLEWLGIIGMAPFLMILLAFLMISTIEYPKINALFLKRKSPFFYLVVGAVALGGFIFFGELSLAIGFILYVLGGPVYDIFHRTQLAELLLEEPLKNVES